MKKLIKTVLECKIKQAEVMLAKARLAESYQKNYLESLQPLFESGVVSEKDYRRQQFVTNDAILDTQLAQLNLEELQISL